MIAAVRSAAARICSTSCRARAASSGPPEQEVGRAQNHGHLIVRFVRHAAGQLAHDLEALALASALLNLPPGSLVGVHLEYALGPALGITPQDPLRRDVESAPVLGDVRELPLPTGHAPAANRLISASGPGNSVCSSSCATWPTASAADHPYSRAAPVLQ